MKLLCVTTFGTDASMTPHNSIGAEDNPEAYNGLPSTQLGELSRSHHSVSLQDTAAAERKYNAAQLIINPCGSV